MSAKLYFRYGSMNSGKTAMLLAAAHNYIERGMYPMLLTYAGDHRFGVGKISSRLGVSKPSMVFDNNTDLEYGITYDDVNAIFVDEAQFLTAQQVEELHRVAIRKSIPVLCYGLRTDFRGKLFVGSAALMAHAETLEEIKTVCDCGKKATHVLRFKNGVPEKDGDVVQIGDLEYKSVCYSCFTKAFEEEGNEDTLRQGHQGRNQDLDGNRRGEFSKGRAWQEWWEASNQNDIVYW